VSGNEERMHAIRRALCRRAVAHAKNGTTDLAPDMMHNDVATYFDPGTYAQEHRRLFREMPLVACLSSDLPEPGSCRLFDDTGIPILVLRGTDGAVRAFLNICPHRGARLVREDAPNAIHMTCRFHGWTFDTEGRAVGVPQESLFCGRIDAQKHLAPCPAEERHGLVFVKAAPNGTMDLDAHLGTFGAELEWLDLAEASRAKEGELRNASNWKYALDTYFESYHLPVLHRDSLVANFATGLLLFDKWGLHHRLVFPHRQIHDWVERPESEWPVDSLGLTYFIFPNTLIFSGSLSPTSSFLSTFRLFPLSVGEMNTRMTIYAPRGVNSPEHRAEIGAGFDAMREPVENEDYAVTGESWRNLAALPAGTKIAYGRQEIAVQSFHRDLTQVMSA
jgi:nitrite reductase/ring-hydroxylating ferredoxin subunit